MNSSIIIIIIIIKKKRRKRDQKRAEKSSPVIAQMSGPTPSAFSDPKRSPEWTSLASIGKIAVAFRGERV